MTLEIKEIQYLEFDEWLKKYGFDDEWDFLTPDDWSLIEAILAEDSELDSDSLHSLFMFDINLIASWLGFKTYEQVKKARKAEAGE